MSRNVARKLLFIQFLAVASGLLFLPQKTPSGHLRSMWGLAVALPNILFMIFAGVTEGAYILRAACHGLSPSVVKPSRYCLMLVLLVVALAVFKTVFLRLIVTWVLVLVVPNTGAAGNGTTKG